MLRSGLVVRKGYRWCEAGQHNRAEKHFSSSRAKKCSSCLKKTRSKATHEARVMNTYGLGAGEWNQLFEAQGCVCAVCKKPPRSGRFDTDHDHKTGVVRGIICASDNRKVLKYARDDPARLRAAARYLESFPAFEAIGLRYHSEDGKEGEMPEYWKSIPGHGNWYEVSTYGRVRSWITKGNQYQEWELCRREEPKILKDAAPGDKYAAVNLSVGSVRKKVQVHRLVATVFLGEPPFEGAHACHNNGQSRDNRLSNLRWDTAQGNCADKLLHGTQQEGEKHHAHKLTEDEVRWARSVYEKGSKEFGSTALAKHFRVAQSSMYAALTGKTWKHLPFFESKS